MKKLQGNGLGILIVLTLLLVLGLLAIASIHFASSGLQSVAVSTMRYQLLSPFVLIPFSAFLGTQLLVYAVFVYCLWYVACALAEWLELSAVTARYVAILLWCISLLGILSANVYYVPHSFFSILLQHNLWNDALNRDQWLLIFLCASGLCVIAISVALIQMLMDLRKKKHLYRHGIMLIFIAMLAWLMIGKNFLSRSPAASAATADKPNIIIIGFDALRPDYLNAATPHFHKFLQSATVFADTYAALARTLPSLTSVLTAQYPLHHHAREDCINVQSLDLSETLPKRLKQIGYATVFAADDNRFSYINKEFGFDRVIGDKGDINDYILNIFNDFPLSNLLVPTPIGKLLFPYNYANHAAAFTHDPNNFLSMLQEFFQQRTAQPLFMMVHFNVTAFPFFGFNDQQAYNSSTFSLYQASVYTADQVLAAFMDKLQQAGLLKHAMVVLLSDHGLTLALPGERVTREALYQGNKGRIMLQRVRYATIEKKLDMQTVTDHGKNVSINVQADRLPAMMDPHNYGIDTSSGYGSDLLSLKQNRALLAFKAYGINSIPTQVVQDRTLLLDIAPTILDWLHLPPLRQADGISLATYLRDPATKASKERPIFLESGYSLPEIQQDGILIDRVLAKSINLFEVDLQSGLVYMLPQAEKISISNKQRAILQGDWLLVYFPVSIKYRRIISAHNQVHYEQFIAPPYSVLVNLKTLQWTSELTGAFAATAPLSVLTTAINQFYADEMHYYNRML